MQRSVHLAIRSIVKNGALLIRGLLGPGSAKQRFALHRVRDTRPDYAASAFAGFSGAVIAPDVLISATSFAE